MARLENAVRGFDRGCVDIVLGNLLSRPACERAASDVAVVFHLAAGGGGKSFPDAVMNSVVTTRNLLDACRTHTRLRRFVNVSSFAVYSNRHNPRRNWLDEDAPVEQRPELRGDPYCFGKIGQDAIVEEYGARFGLPYVIVRPGCVFGPGKHDITGRVGVDTFGLFVHLGGSNPIPFTYVDNCADAIVLAGITPGVDGEVFNVVDDNLPSSRQFLRWYKTNVRHFRSVYLPHAASRLFSVLWERYSHWSDGQLPPVFNSRRWHANWKRTHYTNARLKERLGWRPAITMSDGLRRYAESYRVRHA